MIAQKRVLLLYITERSGHHSAALAIKKALELKAPGCQILCVNGFRYAFPFFERIIHYLYLAVIKRVPKIWERMYDNPALVRKSGRIKAWIHHQALKKIGRLIKTFRPDAIVCTQAFPCGIVADYKKIHPSDAPLVAVLTDFAPHSFWVYDEVDQYVVPAEESKALLMEKGVPAGKIKILGIPIDPKFSAPQDRSELMAGYGLKEVVPVVMIMGGGHGLGPIRDVIFELDLADRELQIIVICGLNKKLYRWLNKTSFKNRVLRFKFTDQIERLMSIASVIITKPGGITTAEVLAKGVPMVILNPIPGQETRNTEILLKSSAALKADHPKEVWSLVKKALETRQAHRGRLSKPNSSRDIADMILSL